MINEIKVDHTKPVWSLVWNNETIGKQERLYLYTIRGMHYCVHSAYVQEFLNGKPYDVQTWTFIEFKKEKKRIQLDAKSCPRRPVLTHTFWGEGVEMYPSITVDGLEGISMYSWDLLFKGGYLINGLPASREVDE